MSVISRIFPSENHLSACDRHTCAVLLAHIATDAARSDTSANAPLKHPSRNRDDAPLLKTLIALNKATLRNSRSGH